MKEWLKQHWKDLLIAILTAVLAVLSACGSTWRISDNTVNVNNKCQNDSITHHNDTINYKIWEISKEGMD